MNRVMRPLRLLAIVVLLAGLSACGGASDSAPAPAVPFTLSADGWYTQQFVTVTPLAMTAPSFSSVAGADFLGGTMVLHTAPGWTIQNRVGTMAVSKLVLDLTKPFTIKVKFKIGTAITWAVGDFALIGVTDPAAPADYAKMATPGSGTQYVSAAFVSTDHTWSSSLLIPQETWIYGRIINAGGAPSAITVDVATGAFQGEAGSTLVGQRTGQSAGAYTKGLLAIALTDCWAAEPTLTVASVALVE